jgi:signal transduction histidine kinase/ActR/RegA family two-component response regulator
MTHLDCQAFFNFLADEQAGRLHLNAFGGISEEEALNIEWLDYGVAVCGCAAQQNCRIVVEDILNVPDSRADLVRSYGIQAYCCHPLMAQDRVIGTLSFGTKTRAHFTPEDVDVMSTVADQVAVALQRVFNLRALRELNKSLDQRVNVRTAEVQRQARRLHVLAAELALTEQRERKRLAAVLHDHIQQILVAARMHLSLVKRAGSMTLGPAVQGVESLIREAIDATRSLAVDLSPPILHQGMLAPSLDWLANRMEEKHLFKVRVRADSAAEPEMESVRLMLFESVREVLLNAAKHSGVHEAEVMMVLDSDDWTRITIEDKGSGFDPKVANDNRSGLGLFAVQQRLSYIGGKMEVQSAPGRGTRVILLAPPEKARKNAPEPAAANSEVLEQELIGLSQKENKICILIVDDHRIVRQGLSSMLQLEPDLDIVAEAEDGEQALELARRFKPDVVITDVSMPGMDGVKLTRTLIQELPGVKVLGLSMHIEKDVAAAMRDAGAIGYLSKDGLSEDLITAIRACAVGR